MLGNFALLGDIGAPELIIILAIVLVLFGGKRLPELTKSLSESVRELRSGFSDSTPSPVKSKKTTD
jgi:sec-independent protein translocase protein TatA